MKYFDVVSKEILESALHGEKDLSQISRTRLRSRLSSSFDAAAAGQMYGPEESSRRTYQMAYRGIIPLRTGLGGEAEANAREHAARRDARLQPFGRAREKGVAHWPVTPSRPVVHLRERPVTG